MSESPKVTKKSLGNLIPAKKGEPSRNPLGVSKAKAELRAQAERFFSKEGITKYLIKLDKLAMGHKDKLSLEAIREILDLTLGKNFTLDLGEETRMSFIEFLQNHAQRVNGND